jgi:hypothetical protein
VLDLCALHIFLPLPPLGVEGGSVQTPGTVTKPICSADGLKNGKGGGGYGVKCAASMARSSRADSEYLQVISFSPHI